MRGAGIEVEVRDLLLRIFGPTGIPPAVSDASPVVMRHFFLNERLVECKKCFSADFPVVFGLGPRTFEILRSSPRTTAKLGLLLVFGGEGGI